MLELLCIRSNIPLIGLKSCKNGFQNSYICTFGTSDVFRHTTQNRRSRGDNTFSGASGAIFFFLVTVDHSVSFSWRILLKDAYADMFTED